MTYTDLRTFKEWRRAGRGILKGEKHVARSRKGCLFDISQTISLCLATSPETDYNRWTDNLNYEYHKEMDDHFLFAYDIGY